MKKKIYNKLLQLMENLCWEGQYYRISTAKGIPTWIFYIICCRSLTVESGVRLAMCLLMASATAEGIFSVRARLGCSLKALLWCLVDHTESGNAGGQSHFLSSEDILPLFSHFILVNAFLHFSKLVSISRGSFLNAPVKSAMSTHL